MTEVTVAGYVRHGGGVGGRAGGRASGPCMLARHCRQMTMQRTSTMKTNATEPMMMPTRAARDSGLAGTASVTRTLHARPHQPRMHLACTTPFAPEGYPSAVPALAVPTPYAAAAGLNACGRAGGAAESRRLGTFVTASFSGSSQGLLQSRAQV